MTSYITTEQPETAMLAAENAAYTQQKPIQMLAASAKELAEKAKDRWGVKSAQWYKWQEIGGKAKKDGDGNYYLDPEQISIYDCLRSHLDENPNHNYNTFKAQLNQEMQTAEIVPAPAQDMSVSTDEGEFVEIQSKGVPRAIQEEYAIAEIAKYRAARVLNTEDLDPDLKEAIAKEKKESLGKFHRRRSKEQFESAIANMVNLLAA